MKLLKKVGEIILDIIETIVISLSIFVILYLLAFQPHEVNGNSMDGASKFHDGQYILTDKVTYRFQDPKRGDVIIFKYPLDKSSDYIKRIIALPEEKIMISNNKVYIYNKSNKNGFILDESSYLLPTASTKGRTFLKENDIINIPKGYYFVMGDNRTHSSDSRAWGLVPKEDIIGKSFLRYWPPNELGIIKSPFE